MNKKQLDTLVKEVQATWKEHVKPGLKPAGRSIFFKSKNIKRPKHDVLHLWRTLFVYCDTTYQFALLAVGDWLLYNRILDNIGIIRKEYIPLWEEERDLRIMAESYSNVTTEINNGCIKTSTWMLTHLTKFNKNPTKAERIKVEKKVTNAINQIDPMDEVIDKISKTLN